MEKMIMLTLPEYEKLETSIGRVISLEGEVRRLEDENEFLSGVIKELDRSQKLLNTTIKEMEQDGMSILEHKVLGEYKHFVKFISKSYKELEDRYNELRNLYNYSTTTPERQEEAIEPTKSEEATRNEECELYKIPRWIRKIFNVNEKEKEG